MKTANKLFLQIALFLVALMAVSAHAIPLPAEYELIHPDTTVGMPTYTVGTDLGFYIWTDNGSRKSWHIRWTGDGSTHYFSGFIQLENNVFGQVDEIYFLSGPGLNILNDSLGFFTIESSNEQGIDFTINNIASPSYVGFDLFIDNSQVTAGENTFIGANNFTVDDGDFKIAAPIPEPATMFLFGTGLIGFAGWMRKKNN